MEKRTFSQLSEDSNADHRKRKRNRVVQSCVPCHANKRKCDRGRPFCSRCMNMNNTKYCRYETEDLGGLESYEPGDPASESTRLRKRLADLEDVVRALKEKGSKRRGQHESDGEGEGTNMAASSPGQSTGDPLIGGTGGHDSAISALSSMASAFPPHGMQQSRPFVPVDGSVDWPNEQRRASRTPAFVIPAPILLQVTPAGETSYPDLYATGMLPEDEAEGSKSVKRKDGEAEQVYVGVSASALLMKLFNDMAGADSTRVVPVQAMFPGLVPTRLSRGEPFPWKGERANLDDILDALPDSRTATQLIKVFTERVEVIYHFWHTPILLSRFNRFFSLEQVGQAGYDRGWIALFLAVLAHAVYYSDDAPSLSDAVNVQLDTKREGGKIAGTSTLKDAMRRRYMQAQLYASACDQVLASLTASETTIESIQARLLLGLWLFNLGRTREFWDVLAVIIKQSQILMLHVDPAKLSRNMHAMDMEVRRRLWWTILSWDSIIAASFGWPPGCTSSDTDQPQDRSDESLNGDNPEKQLRTLPPEQVTKSSFHIYILEVSLYTNDVLSRIFEQRQWNWQSLPTVKSAHFEVIQSIDRAIETWYTRVPPLLRYDPENANPDYAPISAGEPSIETKPREPVWTQQAIMLSLAAHTTLLIMHRPILVSPEVNHDSPSVAKCFEATHVIIRAQAESVLRFPYFAHRTLLNQIRTYQAAVSLAFCLVRFPEHRMLAQAIEDLALAGRTFQDSAPHSEYCEMCASSLTALNDHVHRILNSSFDTRAQLFPGLIGQVHSNTSFALDPSITSRADHEGMRALALASTSDGLSPINFTRTSSINQGDILTTSRLTSDTNGFTTFGSFSNSFSPGRSQPSGTSLAWDAASADTSSRSRAAPPRQPERGRNGAPPEFYKGLDDIGF